jgi:hypothetical protein
MDSIELVRIAVAILNEIAVLGRLPRPETIRILREAAPDLARQHSAIDALACEIIKRELAKNKTGVSTNGKARISSAVADH